MAAWTQLRSVVTQNDATARRASGLVDYKTNVRKRRSAHPDVL
jgi:uncharacterized short protein YbdD (DUF466 family)